jgi:hypothetical protein
MSGLILEGNFERETLSEDGLRRVFGRIFDALFRQLTEDATAGPREVTSGYFRTLRRGMRPSGSVSTILPDSSIPPENRVGRFCCFGRDADRIVSRRNMPTDSNVIKATKRSTSVQMDPVIS